LSLPPASNVPSILILGAGPAGLACAYEAAGLGARVSVLERDTRVGGLCRTIERNGNYFDIGGHRFFSKVDEINQLWHRILGKDLITVVRKSRIYFQKKYYDYPLKLFNVLANLGIWNAFLCFLSYLRILWQRAGDERTFEGWVSNRFGVRLYRIFFKTYTEKVWGIPCAELSSDWAVQRICGMSLRRALVDAFWRGGEANVKSLTRSFLYPTYGPGLFCDRLKTESENLGVQYELGQEVIRVHHDGERVTGVLVRDAEGKIQAQTADRYVSSIPLPVLVERLVPGPPEPVRQAAASLHFRSFLVVNVVLNRAQIFDDNWIYIHSPEVRLGRIQNYKNWSHYMVRDLQTTMLGLEYFVTEGDACWRRSDAQMIAAAMQDLETIGIAGKKDLLEAFVVRIPKVYPVYDEHYQKHVQVLREYLESFENLQVMGRCGMFRYDNSDHALLSGLYAARNLYGSAYDLWNINTEEEYHEEFGPYNKPLSAV